MRLNYEFNVKYYKLNEPEPTEQIRLITLAFTGLASKQEFPKILNEPFLQINFLVISIIGRHWVLTKWRLQQL
jgi:hypothetical protein